MRTDIRSGDSYTSTGFKSHGERPSLGPGGNPIGNPPFPGDTTSNGSNWIGKVTGKGGILTYNYAAYAAVVNNSIIPPPIYVPDFVNQCNSFYAQLVPPPSFAQWRSDNSIFAIWFGINDIGQSLDKPDVQATMLSSLFSLLSELYATGARRFIIFSVPRKSLFHYIYVTLSSI